jgi:hypothetical protein
VYSTQRRRGCGERFEKSVAAGAMELGAFPKITKGSLIGSPFLFASSLPCNSKARRPFDGLRASMIVYATFSLPPLLALVRLTL